MTKTDGPEIIESRFDTVGGQTNLQLIASGYGSIHLMKKEDVESKIEKVEALNKDWSSHLLNKMLTRKTIVLYDVDLDEMTPYNLVVNADNLTARKFSLVNQQSMEVDYLFILDDTAKTDVKNVVWQTNRKKS